VLALLVVALLVPATVSTAATVERQNQAYDERDQALRKMLEGGQADVPEAPKMPEWHVL
jgi:hypothetical protein